MRQTILVAVLVLVPMQALAQPAETIEYYGRDMLGSIRIVFDVTGTALGRQDYGPFGRPLFTAPAMPKDGFGAQQSDHETDLAYFHARMFEPRIGRFTRVDPIFSGLFEPQRWNRYSYALNSPVNYSDFDGLLPTTIRRCGESNSGRGYPCPDDPPFPWVYPFDDAPNWQGTGRGGPGGRGGNNSGKGGSGEGGEGGKEGGGGVDGDEDDPPETDCTEFAKTLTNAFLTGGGANGRALMGVAMANPWASGSKSDNTWGFKEEQIRNGQGNDVYRHIVFMTGAAFSDRGALIPFVAYDLFQAATGRAESKTELTNDLTGLAVAFDLAVGSMTGNVQRTQKSIVSKICK